MYQEYLRRFTKKLKIILQSNTFYVILGIFIFVYIFLFTKVIKYQSVYDNGTTNIIGKVTNYNVQNDKISLEIKAKEKIKATYYLKNNEEIPNIQFGSIITIEGELKTPSKNTIPNIFNYQKYLYNKKIYKVLTISNIKSIDNKNSLLSKIKNVLYQRTSQNEYLKAFVVGDKSFIEEDIYESFQNTGVAHLLAISGMHAAVLLLLLNKMLFFVSKNKRQIIIILFLFFYMYIVNFLSSIVRVVVFYLINYLNKKFGLNIDGKKILVLTGFSILLYNPFYIYDIGFLYSFSSVYGLLLTKKYFKNNYIINLLIVSFWSMMFTLPITVYLNYEINLLLFVSNLLLVPYITLFLYPFSLLCFAFPIFLSIFNVFVDIMEVLILYLNKFDFLIINIPKLSMFVIGIYYTVLLFLVCFNYKRLLFLILFLLICVKFNCVTDSNYYVEFFDVRQGDSSIIISPYRKEVVMIDSGGLVSYGQNNKVYFADNIILYLKSIGISSLSTLIITHGDYDHMGEAINLVNNFKVEKVIFNCGQYNDLELDLIKVLDKKIIPYYSCIKELNIDNNKLYFLNNKIYDNENDNSSVIYTELNNHKFLFMGDAGVEVEQDLIDKYNLQDIDVLKVGHHGSKTSSSKSFIDEINPKYSIISVGKNNRYGHPNKEVLNNLDNSKIYRTDQDGSIMFKINKDKLKIETCTP